MRMIWYPSFLKFHVSKYDFRDGFKILPRVLYCVTGYFSISYKGSLVKN